MNLVNRGAVMLSLAALSTGCSLGGSAAEPELDQLEGIGAPAFSPMLVVPLPDLGASESRSGRPLQALQARQTPLGDVLLAMFKDSDINLVIDSEVESIPCTFDIKSSTVEETFEALLQSLDLAYEWDGTFLRINDTVRETISIDLIDNSQQMGQGMGGMGGGAGGAGGGAGGGQAQMQESFWTEIEGKLPMILGPEAQFVVNKTAAAIHVEASPNSVQRLRHVIDTTIGRANRQVSLEARVLEVRLDNEYSLGVDWSALPGAFKTSNEGLAAGGGIVSQAARSGGSALTFGLLDTDNFSVFVDALQEQGQVRVLSSPRVSTLNNQMATIQVTDQIPYIVREVITTQGVAQTQYSVEFAESGVMLLVRPLIGDDGLLSVSVTPSVREQVGTVVTPDGLVSVPVISQRGATTTVRVPNGQGIALGGLRSTRKGEVRGGVPFLMDVPLLGQLFSRTLQERTEVELMIMLVPRVLDEEWIDEELKRGSHRLVQLRKGFQVNPIDLEGYRAEDWSGGILQGAAKTAKKRSVRIPDQPVASGASDQGMTVTRQGLADHLLKSAGKSLAVGDISESIAQLESALDLEPTRPDALVASGILHERRGSRERARQRLDAALSVDAEDIIALTARGTLALSTGSAHSARRYFERAHELGNTPLTASNLAASLIELGEFEMATVLLRPMADGLVAGELYANLAFCELQGGEIARARAALRSAYVSGVDARSPRIVALEQLIGDAEAAQVARPPAEE